MDADRELYASRWSIAFKETGHSCMTVLTCRRVPFISFGHKKLLYFMFLTHKILMKETRYLKTVYFLKNNYFQETLNKKNYNN